VPGEWQKKVASKAWPKISQHEESLGRMANFALGSLYGSGVPAKDIMRRAIGVRREHDGSHKELVKASIAAMRFLGDNFNKYLGTLEPEDYFARPSHTGSEPSPVLLEALNHEHDGYNGGIKFPETLDMLEESGVISKADFYKIANLQAVCDQRIAGLSKELENTQDVAARSRIRDEMVAVNCDSVGTLLCAFAHMFKPNPVISQTEDVTMDVLRQEFPMQFEVGRSWQYSYGAVACVNRIIREQKGVADQPDPVIAELERNGEYTPEFLKELRECMSCQTDKTNVPVAQLPDALQRAIETVGSRAREQIAQIPGAGRIRKAIYNNINAMNAEISVCNGAGRHYYVAQQNEAGQGR